MTDRFETHFGQRPHVVASAPGRVNLIGEHTDYNGGFVLPIALPQETRVYLAVRRDSTVRACSLEHQATVQEFVIGQETRGRGWLDHLQGVTRALVEHGHRVPGFDVLVTSEVPIGKGLASSAALEVSLTRALRAACNLDLDGLAIASVAHRAETAFVGVPVGIMDQVAVSLADEETALLLDAETLSYEHVPVPPDAELAVIDSGIAHQHTSGSYRLRRHECEEAAARLGVATLRRVSAVDLPETDMLPEPLNRRVRHVVTENERVLQTAAALRSNDLAAVGKLFLASHVSMRDDFEVSVPEIDQLVDVASSEPHVFGARMTGGGFGGSIVMLCERPFAAKAAAHVANRYRQFAHQKGKVLLPQPVMA